MRHQQLLPRVLFLNPPPPYEDDDVDDDVDGDVDDDVVYGDAACDDEDGLSPLIREEADDRESVRW